MMHINDKEYRSILDTVYDLNCCRDKETFLSVLMPSLINTFHADCATFHLVQGCAPRLQVVESRSFKSEQHSLSEDKYYPGLYAANYYHDSPLLNKAINSPGPVFKTGESISLKEWERSVLYNQFIAPQNLFWELFLPLRWKNNLEGMITLWRAREEGNYSSDDVSKAEILAPHLRLATHNIASLSQIYLDGLAAESGRPGPKSGLLLLDERLQPVYINEKARLICQCINQQPDSGGGLSPGCEFRLPFCLVQDCSGLLQSIKKDCLASAWPRERIVVVPGLSRYYLEIALIWKYAQFSSKPNFLILMNEIDADQPWDVSLQTRLKLSRREMEVIHLFSRGLSYDEIGARLFISKLTVHTHIKNIYRKTGDKNRLELYRLVQIENRDL